MASLYSYNPFKKIINMSKLCEAFKYQFFLNVLFLVIKLHFFL